MYLPAYAPRACKHHGYFKYHGSTSIGLDFAENQVRALSVQADERPGADWWDPLATAEVSTVLTIRPFDLVPIRAKILDALFLRLRCRCQGSPLVSDEWRVIPGGVGVKWSIEGGRFVRFVGDSGEVASEDDAVLVDIDPGSWVDGEGGQRSVRRVEIRLRANGGASTAVKPRPTERREAEADLVLEVTSTFQPVERQPTIVRIADNEGEEPISPSVEEEVWTVAITGEIRNVPLAEDLKEVRAHCSSTLVAVAGEPFEPHTQLRQDVRIDAPIRLGGFVEGELLQLRLSDYIGDDFDFIEWVCQGSLCGAQSEKMTIRISDPPQVQWTARGSGTALPTFVAHRRPRRLILFSRDELKQYEMREEFPDEDTPVRYFIGDVRDRERLARALDRVDVVIHAAALKQVPTAEYNPLEVIKTNVLGAANLIDEAIDRGVERVIALSTDKAASPVNLYGATKLCADKLFTSASVYSGPGKTRFSVVRYGNVVGSRGSVIPLFESRRESGAIPITDRAMTRFWITLEQAAAFVVDCVERMSGGEIFVPKLPSMRITDLGRAIAPECRQEIIGIRPGEKIHEVLVTEDEARRTIEFDEHFVVLPTARMQLDKRDEWLAEGAPVPEGFLYSSDRNPDWLGEEDLRRLLKEG